MSVTLQPDWHYGKNRTPQKFRISKLKNIYIEADGIQLNFAYSLLQDWDIQAHIWYIT